MTENGEYTETCMARDCGEPRIEGSHFCAEHDKQVSGANIPARNPPHTLYIENNPGDSIATRRAIINAITETFFVYGTPKNLTDAKWIEITVQTHDRRPGA